MPPNKQPVHEYAAERIERLRRTGTVPASGGIDGNTATLLEAIQALRNDIAAIRDQAEGKPRPAPSATAEDIDVRIEIAQMVRIITQAKQEIASIKHPMANDDRMVAATSELDAIVLATETSTHDILAAAEAIEGMVRSMSNRLQDEDSIAMADHVANEIIKIFEACNFQDITGQRMNKVVRTIKFIEERILAMIEIWGIEAFAELPLPNKSGAEGDKALMNGPQLTGLGISQEDINALFD